MWASIAGVEFAAAQAAEKQYWRYRVKEDLFAAAQAAEKRQNRRLHLAVQFAAAQAAEKCALGTSWP